MKEQTPLKTALLLTLLALLTACGAQKATDSESFASRTPVTSTSSSSSSALLYCNQKSQDGVTAKVMVYTDSANQVRNDYMKVKFTQLPAGFFTGDYIEFFRWQANTSNQVYLDPAPLQARFEAANGTVLTSFSPVIYWGQVSSLAASAGFNDVNSFFQNVHLVVDVRDPQANFDVLKMAMYSSSSNANTVNMDILMPAFSASPSDYANDNGGTRASVLQVLHPFASMINQNWTATQFQSMSNGFCF
ncbi:MAG: hypothetical protein ACXWRE_09040 [Pseudobdellovibrionaceae bacterium]